MNVIIRSVIGLWMCTACVPCMAEVYKWTDAQGNVHFGDRPPQHGAKRLQMPAAPQNPVTTPADRLVEQRSLLQAFEEERRQKRDEKEQARKDRAERESKCAWARDDLLNQERAGAIYRLDEKGERVYMDDEQREQSLAQARATVERWCGK